MARPPSRKPKCSATTSRGTSCRNSVVDDQDVCASHDPRRICAEPGCGNSTALGRTLCYLHSDPRDLKLKRLIDKKNKLEKKQRPPAS